MGPAARGDGRNQVDRHGNQNPSAFGPLQHPTRQMFGVRGAPGNTINHATSYWVGNHSKRVFCSENVDIVSGIGWDKVDPDNPAYRFVDVYRVVSNLGVFDFGGPDHDAGAVTAPGVEPDEVRENTSFEVHGPDDADRTRLPSGEEQASSASGSTRRDCATRK